jgi:hypothetical protein
MKNVKNKEIKNSTESLTRKIFLAGLGTLVKGKEVINRKYELISSESKVCFDNLVVTGEQIEKEAINSLSKIKNDRLMNDNCSILLFANTEEVFS